MERKNVVTKQHIYHHTTLRGAGQRKLKMLFLLYNSEEEVVHHLHFHWCEYSGAWINDSCVWLRYFWKHKDSKRIVKWATSKIDGHLEKVSGLGSPLTLYPDQTTNYSMWTFFITCLKILWFDPKTHVFFSCSCRVLYFSTKTALSFIGLFFFF